MKYQTLGLKGGKKKIELTERYNEETFYPTPKVQPLRLSALALLVLRVLYNVSHTSSFSYVHSSKCLIRLLLKLGCPSEAEIPS